MNNIIISNKQKIISDVTENLKNFSNLFIMEYRGLDVVHLTKLRRALKMQNMKMNIYKNSLAFRALSKLKIGLDEYIKGPNAFVFAKDEVLCSNILFNFSKKNKNLIIKSGFVNNKIIGVDEIKIMANLPNRENLILIFLGCLKNSILKFLCAISELAKIKEAK